ncbi:MAG: creatininase family protein [Chloroflexi bacterium]|nr:creatininase family protein [Chloroflexota bacterium]
MRTIFWQQLRRGEIEQAAKEGAAVIVPIGSTEQHGPHLPVDTDIRSSSEIALRAARRINEFPVLIAPPVWSGYSPHQMHFPGTITLRADVFIGLLVDVGTSIAKHGFRKIFFLNGHGGNRGLVITATMKLSDVGVEVASATYWDMITEEINQIRSGPLGSIGHSCELETSTQLAIQPENVDMGQAVGQLRTKRSRFFSIDMVEPHRVFFSPTASRSVITTGVAGDPSYASAEEGERFLDAAADAVATFLREYHAI